VRDAARRFTGSFDLGQRQPSMIEKRPAGRRQLDPVNAANEKLGADLPLQIAQLPTEGGLCRVQPPLGRHCHAALFGDSDEIA
jgi:hypothetical protein